VRVALADDSELFREGLGALLEASGIEVVAQVGSGNELVARLDDVAAAAIDAVIMDIRMPPTFTEEGLNTADGLRLTHPRVAVLVLSTYAETAYAMRAFRHGAAGRGYLLKDAVNDPALLRAGLERLHAGGSILDSSIVDRLMAGSRRRGPLAALSDRQRLILQMVAEGSPDALVAKVVGIPEELVKNQVEDIFRTLGISTEDPGQRLVSVVSWLRSDALGPEDVSPAGRPS
jgi:DNA-binding NarL/FixJ family response regulator